ncbi:hypothetical protein [Brevundimonas diminuta]|uniref:hypothetical protein n=1 Tax=Brevundimonas diminuta TaxID=293 RepID=UPI003D05F284
MEKTTLPQVQRKQTSSLTFLQPRLRPEPPPLRLAPDLAAPWSFIVAANANTNAMNVLFMTIAVTRLSRDCRVKSLLRRQQP